MGPTASDFVRAFTYREVDATRSYLTTEDLMTGDCYSIDGATFVQWHADGLLSDEANRGGYAIGVNSDGSLGVLVHNFYSEGYGSQECFIYPKRAENALTPEIYNAGCSNEED